MTIYILEYLFHCLAFIDQDTLISAAACSLFRSVTRCQYLCELPSKRHIPELQLVKRVDNLRPLFDLYDSYWKQLPKLEQLLGQD